MGPVLAFCETWVNRVFTAFSIGAGCPDGAIPGARGAAGVSAQSVFGVRSITGLMPRRPEPSLRAADWASSGLVVGDGHEIAQGLLADVSPALDDLFGRWPLLVADLTGAEDVAAAPASLYVFDALEELGVSATLG